MRHLETYSFVQALHQEICCWEVDPRFKYAPIVCFLLEEMLAEVYTESFLAVLLSCLFSWVYNLTYHARVWTLGNDHYLPVFPPPVKSRLA